MESKTKKSKKKLIILSVVLSFLVLLLIFVGFYAYMAMKYLSLIHI